MRPQLHSVALFPTTSNDEETPHQRLQSHVADFARKFRRRIASSSPTDCREGGPGWQGLTRRLRIRRSFEPGPDMAFAAPRNWRQDSWSGIRSGFLEPYQEESRLPSAICADHI